MWHISPHWLLQKAVVEGEETQVMERARPMWWPRCCACAAAREERRVVDVALGPWGRRQNGGPDVSAQHLSGAET